MYPMDIMCDINQPRLFFKEFLSRNTTYLWTFVKITTRLFSICHPPFDIVQNYYPTIWPPPTLPSRHVLFF